MKAANKSTILLTVVSAGLMLLILQIMAQPEEKPDNFHGYITASTLSGEPEPPPPPPPTTTTTTAPATNTPTATTTTLQEHGTTPTTATAPAPTAQERGTTTTTKPASGTIRQRTGTNVEKPPVREASFLLDSDNDGFTNRREIQLGTDTHNSDSKPEDLNNNGIDDDWEKKYEVSPENGEQDSDNDGLSDKFEYFHVTNPAKADSDADTFNDSREILDMGTNPNDAADPGTIEKIGVRITGMEQNQIFGDPQPFIKGVAPRNGTIEVVAKDKNGKEIYLGTATVGENDIFYMLPAQPLEDGEYDLVTRLIRPQKTTAVFKTSIARAASDDSQEKTSAEKSEVISESKPVRITINKGLNVIPPTPQKLSDNPISKENLQDDLRVEIIDNKPVLLGKTSYNSAVIATWSSIVISSALIADSPLGEFSIRPYDTLGEGDHEVHVQAVRLKDNAASKTIRLPFTILQEQPPEASPETLNPSAETADQQQGETAAQQQTETAQQQVETASTPSNPWFWPVAGLIVLGAAGGIAYYVFRKDKSGSGLNSH